MSDLTLVIPAKYESLSLPQVLKELENFRYNIIIVLEENDKDTIKSVENFSCKIIFQKNKGYGDALIEGIKNVKTKYYCIFNADGSFVPGEIDGMIKKLETERLHIIFGSRYQKNSGSEDDTIVTLIGNFIFTLIGKIFFKLNISDILYTYVLGLTSNTLNLDLKQKDFSFCVELPIKAKRNNLKLGSINSYERKRIAGKKKVNAIKDGFLILKYMILLFFKR
ncbi:glycosyltransferase family 2 protein [Candidatus Pelagibacter sp.]|nr:glycosyltransferase family 2 protein [Candidatus Pelagibacter sp.]